MTRSGDSIESSELTLHLAYAEASVMLLEELMRLLIERDVLAMEEVIETLETTIGTKRLLADQGEHVEISRVAAGILSTLANSLRAGRKPRGQINDPAQ